METIMTFLSLLFFGVLVFFFIGLKKPQKFIPKKLNSLKFASNHPKIFWIILFIILEHFILCLIGICAPESQSSSKPNKAFDDEMSDSLIVQKFKYRFDSLYTVVSNSQINESTLYSIASTGNEILDLLGNQWIEKINNSDTLTRQIYEKEYEISCKKFDEMFPILIKYNYELIEEKIKNNSSIDSSPHKEMQEFLLGKIERICNILDANKKLLPISRSKINDLKKEYDIPLSAAFKTKFSNLYDELIGLDKGNPSMVDREDLHKIIKNYIYEDWWNLMEKLDSTRIVLPKCRKEYKNACIKYDKQYARFCIYGDEDSYNIQRYAKYEAKRILPKVLHDPSSLNIDRAVVIGKVKKGWKTVITYRAKNMFGAYVLNKVYLTMAYDEEERNYTCVDIHE